MPASEHDQSPKLASSHLMTLELNIDFQALSNIGLTPWGTRRIVPVLGGVFAGDRLSGTVLPGADWVLVRPDSNFTIDVRLTLRTKDQELIYLLYHGLFKASPENLNRFRRGETLNLDEYTIRTVANFESGAASCKWLNDVLAIGVGRQSPNGAVYEIFEIL